MIQPVGSVLAETYYGMRNFYQFRRDSPRESAPVPSPEVVDRVELSAQALAALAGQGEMVMREKKEEVRLPSGYREDQPTDFPKNTEERETTTPTTM